MQYFRLFLLCISSLIIAGCASIYVPPKGPTAKLGVLGQNIPFNGNLVFIFDDPITCQGAHILAPMRSRFSGKPVLIAGNKWTTINNNHVIAEYETISQVITFFAKANKTYFLYTPQEDRTLYKSSIKFQIHIVEEVLDKNGKITYKEIPYMTRTQYESDALTGVKYTLCKDSEIQNKLRSRLR